MTHQVVGYVRVSSQGQNTARQLQGIKLDKEFTDMVTGSNQNRDGLKECLDYVREGDELVVDSIDRLARNLQDLQEIVKTLLKKGVSIRFIKENLNFNGKDDPLSNLTLQMMGAFAEFERTIIKSRQREGIEAAKKAGKHLGRPPTITPELSKSALSLKKDGVSIRQISFKLKVSRATVYKVLSSGA